MTNNEYGSFEYFENIIGEWISGINEIDNMEDGEYVRSQLRIYLKYLIHELRNDFYNYNTNIKLPQDVVEKKVECIKDVKIKDKKIKKLKTDIRYRDRRIRIQENLINQLMYIVKCVYTDWEGKI